VNSGGGQMVNPAVSVSMWSLGKCSYTECFVRIAGQMGGGLVAFPIFYEISNSLKLTPFGGPEFSQDNDVEAFMGEFAATFFLMWAIYLVRMNDYYTICFFTTTQLSSHDFLR
jgi:glycerol uptake facilitator-like aquaporin